jgi:hypothetical protein
MSVFHVELNYVNKNNKNSRCWLGIDNDGNAFHEWFGTHPNDRTTFYTVQEALDTINAARRASLEFYNWSVIMDDKYQINGRDGQRLTF